MIVLGEMLHQKLHFPVNAVSDIYVFKDLNNKSPVLLLGPILCIASEKPAMSDELMSYKLSRIRKLY